MANLKINTEKRKSLRSRLACLLSLSLDVDVVVWWCRTDVSCIASAFRLRSGPPVSGIHNCQALMNFLPKVIQTQLRSRSRTD